MPIFPLRSYSSLDPKSACTKPAAVNTNGAAEKEKILPSSSHHGMKANHFVTHKVGDSLEDSYIVGDMIGEGAFGEVFCCRHRSTNSERAAKALPKSTFSERDNEQVRNEFSIVKNLDHPNIMKQYNMYESEDKFYIVTDIYKGGEMFDELEKIGRLTEADAASLMNQLLSCVNYCHQQNIVHRDLKPENILLSEHTGRDVDWSDIKVIDFGLAQQLNPEEDDGPLTEMVGTPYYCAPQVLEGEYGLKCDIWSCGVIAYLALSGFCPFEGESMGDIMNLVLLGDFGFEDPVWDTVSDEAKDFVKSLLTYEEEKRPSAADALQHSWLVKTRKESSISYSKHGSAGRDCIANTLSGMQNFDTCGHLKQATYALLSSQLLMREEREEIDKVFRVMDTDCSGTLTKDEVQTAFQEFFNKNLAGPEIDALFDKVNFSGSGEIEYSEFVCAALMEKDLLDEDRLLAAFNEFDLDGSGSISVDELKQVFSGFAAVDGDAIDAIIEQVDMNNDGEIDFNDFQTMMLLTTSQPSMETLEAWNVSKARFNFDVDFNASAFSDFNSSFFSD